MAEAVLRELREAGIQNSQIRFLCALGTHGANNRRDFAAKLGEEIVRNYRIYNHNCYENCDCIGTTGRGVEVRVNREFMQCDLKIGLGAITPHPYNSFGGGGKILFPGLASIDTIQQNHLTAIRFLRKHRYDSTQMMGDLRLEGMREEIEEMTRMVGSFFVMNCIYNSKLEPVDLFVGDPLKVFYAGVPHAQKLYGIEKAADRDIVVVNANAKATEAGIAVSLGAQCLGEQGGDIVLVNYTDLGQVTHYLFGCFGTHTGGRLCAGGSARGRDRIHRIICLSPWPEPAGNFWFGEEEKIVYVDTWQETLALLQEKYSFSAKVSVLSDATLSFIRHT
jgi:nickel-dependent lactate racemase